MFGSMVLKARVEARMTQAELERTIGKSRGYAARVESETIFPPRAVVEQIAEALNLDPADAWRVSARDRLQADPDLWAWHEEQVAAAAAVDETATERRPFHTEKGLRRRMLAERAMFEDLDRRLHQWDATGLLVWAVEAVLTADPATGRDAAPVFVACLQELAQVGIPRQHEAWRRFYALLVGERVVSHAEHHKMPPGMVAPDYRSHEPIDVEAFRRQIGEPKGD